MSPALVRALAWRRLRSRPRLALVAGLVAVELCNLVLRGECGAVDGQVAGLAALTFGAGLLGQERREGSLAVLLCRPIDRTGLALCGWLAACGSGLLAWSVALLASLPLALLPGVEATWSLRELALQSSTAACAASGMAAVALAFGVAFRGLSGVAAHLLLLMGVFNLLGWARDAGRSGLDRAATELFRLLLPVPDVQALLAPRGWSWSAALGWASNVTLLLCLACWILRRSQLGHAARG